MDNHINDNGSDKVIIDLIKVKELFFKQKDNFISGKIKSFIDKNVINNNLYKGLSESLEKSLHTKKENYKLMLEKENYNGVVFYELGVLKENKEKIEKKLSISIQEKEVLKNFLLKEVHKKNDETFRELFNFKLKNSFINADLKERLIFLDLFMSNDKIKTSQPFVETLRYYLFKSKKDWEKFVESVKDNISEIFEDKKTLNVNKLGLLFIAIMDLEKFFFNENKITNEILLDFKNKLSVNESSVESARELKESLTVLIQNNRNYDIDDNIRNLSVFLKETISLNISLFERDLLINEIKNTSMEKVFNYKEYFDEKTKIKNFSFDINKLFLYEQSSFCINSDLTLLYYSGNVFLHPYESESSTLNRINHVGYGNKKSSTSGNLFIQSNISEFIISIKSENPDEVTINEAIEIFKMLVDHNKDDYLNNDKIREHNILDDIERYIELKLKMDDKIIKHKLIRSKI